MKRIAGLLLCAGLVAVCVGCGPSDAEHQGTIEAMAAQTVAAMPTNTSVVITIAISEMFKGQVMTLLEEGARLNAMTESGVSYVEFGKQIPNVNAAYDLAAVTWPEGYAEDARAELEIALVGWDLARYLWGLKIGDKDNPVEPNLNGYHLITAYDDRGLLVVETHPEGFIVEEYRGKKYLPFDENISALLSLAGAHFEKAQAGMFEAIEYE